MPKSNRIPQPRLITIFCWILGVSTSEFPVDIDDSLTVGHLKDQILAKNLNTLPGVDAAQLMLWQVSIQVSRQLKTKVNELQFLEELSLLGGELLGELFPPPQPSKKTLHIVVQRPSDPTITASRSSDSNIAAYIALKRAHPESSDDLGSTKRARGDIDGWLSEIHGKIWNQKDQLQELVHTVEITTAHYNELQERLDKLYPNRHTPEYMAGSKSVLSIKLDILRNFQPPLVSPTPEHATHAGNKQADNNENNDDDELRSIFPITITYMDLSCLQLEGMTLRMPLAFLIRDEYKILDGIVDGLLDSGIISGQPGTGNILEPFFMPNLTQMQGKTTYIHRRIIGSMLNGKPFLYQSLSGTVYYVSDIVTMITSLPSLLSGSTDIVAYVDADQKKFEPQMFIRHSWIKIIAASSPSGTDQPWLKQMGNNAFPLTFASALWTSAELFVTGLFLHPRDLTYARLKEATTYFGFSPRLCFNASREERQLRELQNKVKVAVKKAASKRDIRALIFSYENSMMLSHTIFELSPRDDLRLFGDALIGSVSPWALDLLLGAYEARKLDATFEFYESISDIPKAGTLRGRILERQILKHFDNLKGQRTFTLRSLENNSTINWVYPGPTKRHTFQPTTFGKELESAVSNKESLHLVPKDPNFPALDSTVYDPSPGGGLFLNQITTNLHHPVAVIGLQRVQSWLKPNTLLADLRPSIQRRHWPLIFIVPESIADSFTKQPFEGDTITQEWAKKVDQYVLGIKEESLWARMR